MRCAHTVKEVADIKLKDFLVESIAMMEALNNLKLKERRPLKYDFYYVEVVTAKARIIYVSFTGDKIRGENPQPFTEMVEDAEKIS